MKLQFESIKPPAGSSFKLLHHTEARGNNLFWHQHPEYEIVYIPEGSGRRHIGQHIGQFDKGELVFIGPNLPHLNFSYGRQGPFEQIVVQLRAEFMGEGFLQRPELAAIEQLFFRSQQGLAFGAATQAAVGPALRRLLTEEPFGRLLTLLGVLQQLAEAEDVVVLQAGSTSVGRQNFDQQRWSRVYAHIQANFQLPIVVEEVAVLAHLSVPAFCRYFKKMTGRTLTDFVQEYRISHACRLLLEDHTIADVSFSSGFNNLSHFNKTFRKLTGHSPSEFRRQKAG